MSKIPASKSKLLLAVGNPLRRDDGVAHRVVQLLGTLEGIQIHSCIQLTPEVAEDIAGASAVVFIDADVNPGAPALEALTPEQDSANPLSHSVSPSTLVELARRLYGFHGSAYLCRIPGADFSEGEGLTPETEARARLAAELLRRSIY